MMENREVTAKSHHHVRKVRRVLAVTLVLNLAVAGAKLVVGSLIHSISMVADGFHSLTDSASNVVGLIGVSWAARPPDEDHPYGHWKFETLAALLIGGLLAMTALEIVRTCIGRLAAGGAPRVDRSALVVLLVTMVINLAVSAYERRQGSRLGSDLLLADASHTLSDFFVSLTVLASLVAASLGLPQLDLVAALVITLVIARAAFRILQRAGGRLTDSAVVPSSRIRDLALTVDGVEGVHKIRTRSSPTGGHADLHIQVRPELRLDQAHVIGHAVADRLRQELGLGDVVTHVEPPVGHKIDWRPRLDGD